MTTSIKGITADNAAMAAISDLGAKHVSYEMAIDRFFEPDREFHLITMEKHTISIRELSQNTIW